MTVLSTTVSTDLPVRLLVDGVEELSGRIVHMEAHSATLDGIDGLEGRKALPVVLYLHSGERFEGTLDAIANSIATFELKSYGSMRVRWLRRLAAEGGAKFAEAMGIAPDMPLHQPLPTHVPREPRVAVDNSAQAYCERADGTKLACEVRDISLTGLGIAMAPVLKLGERVRIGKADARVVRQTTDGYGLEIVRAARIAPAHNPSAPNVGQRTTMASAPRLAAG